MDTVSARLPREIKRDLERFLRAEGMDRSTATRRLLELGLAEWKKRRALELLREGRVTLWKAASLAGLSLWEMMDLARERRVTLPMDAEDAAEDIRAALGV